MSSDDIEKLVHNLISRPEDEVLEFKEAKQTFKIAELGRYFSALSNEANLKGVSCAWLLFGVKDDGTICGTSFRREDSASSLGLQKLKREIAQEANNRITFRAIHEVYLHGKRIVLLEIPPATRGIPTLWAGAAYAREGESLVPLPMSKIDEIRNQPPAEWGKVIVDADEGVLDEEAVAIVREKVRDHFGDRASLVDDLSDGELLDKTGLTLRGKITNTALMLVGDRQATTPFDGPAPTLTWTLYEANGVERSHEHIRPPFVRGIDEILEKIRNEKIRILDNARSLLPTELLEYDAWSLRELIGNAIAHQDYAYGRRVNVEEFPDRIVVINEGSFIPGTIEKALEIGYKPPRYRNPFVCEAMLHIGMLDQNAMGIRAVFEACRRRHMPLPTYDLSDPERVSVTLLNHEIDPIYGQILRAFPDLPMTMVMLLDKVQKGQPLVAEEEEVLVEDGFARRRADGTLSLVIPEKDYEQRESTAEGRESSGLEVGAGAAAGRAGNEPSLPSRALSIREAITAVLQEGEWSRNEITEQVSRLVPEKLVSVGDAGNKIYRELVAMKGDNLVDSEGATRAKKWFLATKAKSHRNH